MAFEPSVGGRTSPAEQDRQRVIVALRQFEQRLAEEFRMHAVAGVGDPLGVTDALESINERFQDLTRRTKALPELLSFQRREALVRFGGQLRDLRQDLRIYTMMMGIAVVLILLLLFVFLAFRK